MLYLQTQQKVESAVRREIDRVQVQRRGIAVKLEWSGQTLSPQHVSVSGALAVHGGICAACVFCLFLQNGSRRRTPGGVFLNLLKNTPSISEEQIKVKMIMFLTFKIHNNQTSIQPLASFSTNLYQLLCLKLANFVTAPFQVKLVPFIKLCLLFFFSFRAKIKISFMKTFPNFLACNYFCTLLQFLLMKKFKYVE